MSPLFYDNCHLQSIAARGSSRGVLKVPVKFAQDVLGALKGQPHLEWAIVMKGSRSQDGTEVEIHEWFVPQDQERTGANVRLPSM